MNDLLRFKIIRPAQHMNTRRLLGSIPLLLACSLTACSPTCDPAKEKDYCEDGVAHACLQMDGPGPQWAETICKDSPAPVCVIAIRDSPTRPTAFCTEQ